MEKKLEQQTSDEPTEEKLEFLKRIEVRTMAKDIARLRKEEAKKERERIEALQKEPEQKENPQIVLSQQQLPKELSKKPQASEKQKLIPRRPLKQSEKLFIRLFIGAILIFLIFNAVAFGFWYFLKKNTASQPISQDARQEVQAPPPAPIAPQPIPVKPAPPTPVVFFQAPKQELFITAPSDLLFELQDFLLQAPPLGITTITLSNTLSVEEFLQGANIMVPQDLKERLGENFMLFSYVAGQKNRLGFIIDLKDTTNVVELLGSWEESMEQNVTSFFNIIGKKGSAYTPFFRSTSYSKIPIRFQTFSVIDFGIVYGIIDNKLLFTSSLESFHRAVDLLETI